MGLKYTCRYIGKISTRYLHMSTPSTRTDMSKKERYLDTSSERVHGVDMFERGPKRA